MKKSNKLSVFYVIASFILFGSLIFGGCYGIYLSVGLKFVRSNISNLTDGAGEATRVSYGGSATFAPSMTGVIILSIVLIVLSVLDIISLVKQIVLFKQFKAVRNSKIEQKLEKKNKSKGSIIFFAVVVNLLALAAGIAGIFTNMRSFSGFSYGWAMYVVDGAVAVLSVVSIVLLLIKYNRAKKFYNQSQDENKENKNAETEDNSSESLTDKDDQKSKNKISLISFSEDKFDESEIDRLENILIKLKYLKSSRLISMEEFESLREKYLGTSAKRQERESVNQINIAKNENLDEKQ